MVGAMPWRQLKCSILSVVDGLPSGEAERLFCPRIIGKAAKAIGSGTAPTVCSRPLGLRAAM